MPASSTIGTAQHVAATLELRGCAAGHASYGLFERAFVRRHPSPLPVGASLGTTQYFMWRGDDTTGRKASKGGGGLEGGRRLGSPVDFSRPVPYLARS